MVGVKEFSQTRVSGAPDIKPATGIPEDGILTDYSDVPPETFSEKVQSLSFVRKARRALSGIIGKPPEDSWGKGF